MKGTRRNKTFHEWTRPGKGCRAARGYGVSDYMVVAIDPGSGVGQDADGANSKRSAIDYARKMCRGAAVTTGHDAHFIEASALVMRGCARDKKEPVFACSPRGYPLWLKERKPKGQPELVLRGARRGRRR